MNTQLAPRTQTAVTIRSMCESPAYANRFKELLKDRAPQFVASLIQLVNGSNKLRECNPDTVIAAAITAAAMDLPIQNNLGFAYIVPYKGSGQFQMGYKGYIQLAIRTGQYKFLNTCVVYDGELISCDKLTGEIVIDPTKRAKDAKVIGYAAFFRLVNGYEHSEYWTKDEVEGHAQRFSQAYKSGWDTPWKTDFDQMALKTVVKDLISHWGIMSIEMTRALVSDQSVMATVDSEPTFPDNQEPVKGPEFPPSGEDAPTDAPKARKAKVAPVTPPTAPEPPQAAPIPVQAEVVQQEQGEQADPFATNPAPVSPELAALYAAMTAAGVNDTAVMAFVAEKLAHEKGKATVAELKNSTILNLTNHLKDPNSKVTLGIKDEMKKLEVGS